MTCKTVLVTGLLPNGHTWRSIFLPPWPGLCGRRPQLSESSRAQKSKGGIIFPPSRPPEEKKKELKRQNTKKAFFPFSLPFFFLLHPTPKPHISPQSFCPIITIIHNGCLYRIHQGRRRRPEHQG